MEAKSTVASFFAWWGELGLFVARLTRTAFRHPFEGRELLRQLDEIGSKSFPLVALAGAAMVAAGLTLIGTWGAATPAYALVFSLFLQGVGLGFFYVAYTDIVTAAIPPENRGVAGSLAMVTRTIGTVGAAATTF